MNRRCHRCGGEIRVVLDGEEWCPHCKTAKFTRDRCRMVGVMPIGIISMLKRKLIARN